MKKFCMSCGGINEFALAKDTPNKCAHCGAVFGTVSLGTESTQGEDETFQAPVEVPFKVTISSDEPKIETLEQIAKREQG
jgi:DNA-directed RNA polymerase subunit RPC12/RpoP